MNRKAQIVLVLVVFAVAAYGYNLYLDNMPPTSVDLNITVEYLSYSVDTSQGVDIVERHDLVRTTEGITYEVQVLAQEMQDGVWVDTNMQVLYMLNEGTTYRVKVYTHKLYKYPRIYWIGGVWEG